MRLLKHDLSLVAKKVARRVYKKRYIIILVLCGLIALLLFGGFIKMIFFLLLLTGVNIFLSYTTRGIPFVSTSIEIIMLNTILAGLAYGSFVGGVFGVISAILYYLATGRFSYYMCVFAPLYFIIGMIVPFFSAYDIFTVGITFKLIYTVISSIIVIVLFSARIDKAIAFAITNTCWNLVIFKYAAPILLVLMK